jgi:DNA invertase Pin-like site-specific DNA recombinase
MLIGYARVSTQDQDTAAQIAALKLAGCELVFQEKAAGGRWERPELHRLLGQLRKGDVLVIWKLDRLSRSLKDVLTLMEKIQQVGAGFQSVMEAIDTTSPGGRMMMQIVGAFAEFERAMLRERTRNGLDAARMEGRVGGRRPKLKTHQVEEIVHMVSSMCIRLRYRDCFNVASPHYPKHVSRRNPKLKCIYRSTAPNTPISNRPELLNCLPESRWVYGGGKVLPSLVTWREFEAALLR